MSRATIDAPPEPPEYQHSNDLTAHSIIAAFNGLPYSYMSLVLDVLVRFKEQRYQEIIRALPEPAQRTMPPLVHEGDAAKAERLASQGRAVFEDEK